MYKDFYSALRERRSFYAIGSESKVSDDRIEQVIKEAILHAPSAFNSQSARVILLLGEQHKKLWKLTKEVLKEVVGPEHWQQTEDKIDSFSNGKGTVLYFDNVKIVEGLQERFPIYSDNFPVWAQQSNGMLQYMIWTSLQSEGLGASLQHYNPLINQAVKDAWNIPDGWVLNAQMPFGAPTKDPDEKSKIPLEERFFIYK